MQSCDTRKLSVHHFRRRSSSSSDVTSKEVLFLQVPSDCDGGAGRLSALVQRKWFLGSCSLFQRRYSRKSAFCDVKLFRHPFEILTR